MFSHQRRSTHFCFLIMRWGTLFSQSFQIPHIQVSTLIKKETFGSSLNFWGSLGGRGGKSQVGGGGWYSWNCACECFFYYFWIKSRHTPAGFLCSQTYAGTLIQRFTGLQLCASLPEHTGQCEKQHKELVLSDVLKMGAHPHLDGLGMEVVWAFCRLNAPHPVIRSWAVPGAKLVWEMITCQTVIPGFSRDVPPVTVNSNLSLRDLNIL